jgi:hypothetical protein
VSEVVSRANSKYVTTALPVAVLQPTSMETDHGKNRKRSLLENLKAKKGNIDAE